MRWVVALIVALSSVAAGVLAYLHATTVDKNPIDGLTVALSLGALALLAVAIVIAATSLDQLLKNTERLGGVVEKGELDVGRDRPGWDPADGSGATGG